MNKFDEALAKAKKDGHDLVDDPPALSSVRRKTCKQCGDAVLGNATTAYGKATEGPCPQRKDSVTAPAP